MSSTREGNSSWEEKVQLEFKEGIKPYMTDEIHDVLKELGQYLSEEASVVLAQESLPDEEKEELVQNRKEEAENYLEDEFAGIQNQIEEDASKELLGMFREMQLEVLCDKIITKDIIGSNGEVVARKGQYIDEEILKRVKINRCMLQLISNSK